MTLASGTKLGPYEIVSPLGTGGMGEVYRAKDARLGREVAIKVLPEPLAKEPGALARFEREAKAVAALSHPNILAIHDLGMDRDVFFVVTELLEGETLRSALSNGKLSQRKAIDTALQIAYGLAAAHEKGIVHRDLKPENLFLLDDGRVKILDFGLAKLTHREAGEEVTSLPTATGGTEPGVVMGTLGYMSPEQVKGKPADVRSDIFSFGAVLYEMLSGQRAFHGDSAAETISAILREEPPDLSSTNQSISPGLDRLVRHCLEKNPEERLQAARDLAFDLKVILSDSEISKPSPASGGAAMAPEQQLEVSTAQGPLAASAPARKKRAYLYGAVVGVVVLVLGGGLLVRRMREAQRFRAVVARLESAAGNGRLNEVYDQLRDSGLDLSDPGLAELVKRVAGTLSIETDPPEATVAATRVEPIATFASRQPATIGRTPITGRRFVAGEYLIRLSAGRANPLDLLVRVELGKDLRFSRTLLPAGWAPDGMVLVDEGASPNEPTSAAVPAFLIDRFEVTNAQFLKFVSAGGYRDQASWPETLVVNGLPIPWASAMPAFVDRTGLAGPRIWSGGTYPEGKGDHPVVGVSWYEATAYGRWVGRDLPSRQQWWRAAQGETGGAFPWGNDVKTTDLRANFGLVGTRPVGSYPLGISPFGCFDMAGNVREWLRDTAPDAAHRTVVGGSWEDPAYMFEPSHAEAFDPAFASAAIGFRLVMPVPGRR